MMFIWSTGAQIGTIVTMVFSGILCQYVGWESVFYVFGKTSLSYIVISTICEQQVLLVVNFVKCMLHVKW